MTHYMKEDIENQGKHHDDNGTIDDYAKVNGLEEDDYFCGFHENEDVISEAYWRMMRILMGFTRMGMLPARMTSNIWMC